LPRRAAFIKSAAHASLYIRAHLYKREKVILGKCKFIAARARTNYTRQNPILINFLAQLLRDTAENKITSSPREKGESK
jgi:hypothetical protein